MTKEYEYKGNKINFNEARGNFSVVLNGRTVTSSSLSGAQKQVDKYAVENFTPVDVLILTYKDGKQKLESHKIVSYHEKRGTYRNSRELVRYFLTEKGEEVSLSYSYYNRSRVYLPAQRAEVEKLLKEEKEQDEIKNKADKLARELKEKREKLSLDLATIDPKA